MLDFDFLEKGLGIVSPTHFEKCFVIFCYQTKFHCLNAFTSEDIEQYLLQLFNNQLWRHKFWN